MPRAQLLLGDSCIQMENYPFPLNTHSPTWLNPSSTSWMRDIILGIVCGLGLFLLLLPCLGRDPSSPPTGQKSTIRKRQVERRQRPRSRKKSYPLKAHRDRQRELELAQDLTLLLQCFQLKLPDKGGFHQFSCPDPLGKVCKPAPARAHRPRREHVEDASPATSSPLASPDSLAKSPPPLASTLSPGPTATPVCAGSHSSLSAAQPPEPLLPLECPSPQPQAFSPPTPRSPAPVACPLPPADSSLAEPPCDSMAPPLGTVPQSCSPQSNNCWLPPPISMISDLGRTSSAVSALSRWQVAATTGRGWSLSTSPESKSQQGHLSNLPPEAAFQGAATHTHRQMEAHGSSFVNPDDQNLLETLMDKRQEKEKEVSPLKQVSPDYSRGCLGNMVKSQSGDQDTTTPHCFWNITDKPEQLQGPQQQSHPKAVGDHLQQKCSQLFWGLPSLHSESLVAAVRISGPPLEFPSISFNGLSNSFTVQMQTKLPLQLFLPQPWPHHMATPQPQPPPLAGIHPHACLPPSRSTPPYYSPQITFCGVSCPTAYTKAQFPIPTAVQQLECHLLKKQEESRRALPTIVEKSQEVFSQLTPDSWASQTHKSVSSGPGDIINLELWEQHRQTSFTQHRGTLPSGNQPSLGRVQPQGKFPGAGWAKVEQGSSRPSVFAGGSSQDIQDMESQDPAVFQIQKRPSLDLGYCLRSDPDLPLNSDSSLVVLPGASSEEEAESDWMKPSSDTRNDLPGSPDTEHGQDILKVHLSRKLGQIKEGRIPVSVCHSRLATDQALAPSENSNTHKETRTLTSSEGWESYKDTSRELLLDPGNKHVLEAHVRRLWARHRWGLLLKILKMKNLFMLRKAQPPPLPLSTFPSWATCEFGDNSTAKFVNFLGEDPWAEETKEPVEAEEEKPPAWKATLGASVRTDSHTLNVNLSSGSLRNSKSSQPSIISVTQDPEELCLNATIVSECELAVEVEPEKQPQGPAPDVLLQDRTTGVILEDCDPDILAADMWAFQTTVSSSHSKSSAGTRGPCERKSKQSGPTDERERCHRPKPGGHKQRSARPRTSQTSCISQPSQDRVLAESLRTKSSQLLPNKGQAPTGSRFGNKTRQFLQWIFPKKNTGQEEPRQNCKPASATAQCSGPVTGRSFTDTKTDEVQELVTNVGQILEEEIGPNHELLASKGNWYKEELQATGGGHCSYHRGPSHPEQRRVRSDPACSHQATPMGRSSSVKNRCVQDKNNNQGPPARPCQHQPRVARASSHPVHCPRHCWLRRGVLLGQPDHTSPTFPGQQTFFSEQVQFRQRK